MGVVIVYFESFVGFEDYVEGEDGGEEGKYWCGSCGGVGEEV